MANPTVTTSEPAVVKPAKKQQAKRRSTLALEAFHEEKEIDKSADVGLLKSLWPYLRPEKRLLAASMVALVALASASLARPLVMRKGFDGTGTEAELFQAGVTLLGLVLFEQLLSFAQMLAVQTAGARAMLTLRVEVFKFLHSRRVGFFDNQPVGRLVTRVTNDIDAIGELFASGALNAVGDIIKLVGIVVMMLALDWKLALIAFAALPPIGLLVNVTRKRLRDAYREIRVKTARLNAFLAEQVHGMSVTQAYAREVAAQGEFDEINLAYRDANFRAIAFDATLDAMVEMVSSICVAAMISYAGVRPFGEPVSFGTLVAFIAYVEQFFGPIRDLSARYTVLQSSMTGAERVFQLLEAQDEDAVPQPDQAVDGDSSFAFELDHVSFGYKAEQLVLNNVSLTAKQGERIALVGATGSGKSTAASLLLRLHDPQSGHVRVGGKDIRGMRREDARGRFAVVPQDVFLFPGTIADNISVGDEHPDRKKVEAALQRVDALELFTSREGGLDAKVDERGSNFSAGERQLLAFARAVYRDASILVLDEATASVDSVTEARLQRATTGVLEGRTALIIAHRLSTIRAVDRIVVLQKGEVIEQGSHEELLALGGSYAKLHEMQLSGKTSLARSPR
ncbi:MAG: ABC transporter ATP-binding protein [Polyangiaceae bacterium]